MAIFTLRDKTIDEVLCENCLCRAECVGSCPAYIALGENTVVREEEA